MAFTISIAGQDYCELLLYLMRVLQNLGEEILIIDHSKDSEFEACVPIIEELNPYVDVIDYQGVMFTRNEHIEQDSYSVIIHLNELTGINCRGDMLIFFIDEKKAIIDRLLSFPQDTLSEYKYKSLVIRDYIGGQPSKIREVLAYLKIEDRFFIPFSKKSKKIGLSAMYRDRYAFRGISYDEKEFILDIASKIEDKSRNKLVSRAYKKAAGGRVGRI